MAKEWLLNSAMNRFQLNFKRNVGPTSEEIRKCAPKNLKDWEEYYFNKVRSKDHIEMLGRKLYVKITEVLVNEMESITEEDCVNYMYEIVINRTYDGYIREIRTIYGQLEDLVGEKIEAAPDEWDRLFNVDFYIKIKSLYIGIQIKPISKGIQIPQIFKEHEIQRNTHEKFKEKYGGNVYYIFSGKAGDKKVIMNLEVVDEIKKEIKRLKNIR
ncbi:MAG: MjaI family restriction endonuclease [bacterium]